LTASAGPRIVVSTPVRLIGREERSVLLREVSRRTARLFSDAPLGDPGAVVQLVLPSINGDLTVKAQVLSARACAADHDVTVLFVTDDDSAGLEALLDLLLAGRGGGDRRHPRVIHRLAARLLDHPQVEAHIEDVSKGGCGLLLAAREFELGELIHLAVGDLTLPPARVMNQRPDGELFRIGAQFEFRDEAERAAVEALVRALAK
jgi:hypothetical protein